MEQVLLYSIPPYHFLETIILVKRGKLNIQSPTFTQKNQRSRKKKYPPA